MFFVGFSQTAKQALEWSFPVFLVHLMNCKISYEYTVYYFLAQFCAVVMLTLFAMGLVEHFPIPLQVR